MSLLSLCNTEVDVQRKSPSHDASGGQSEGYAAVAGLTGLPANIQPRGGRVVRTLGQRHVLYTHAIYLASDYDIRNGDRVYEPSTGRYFLVIDAADMAGRGQAWRLDVTEQI